MDRILPALELLIKVVTMRVQKDACQKNYTLASLHPNLRIIDRSVLEALTLIPIKALRRFDAGNLRHSVGGQY